jgi:hypothetical protein
MDARYKSAIITVGDGRGFVVNAGRDRCIITAAHCLPSLPLAHLMSQTEERTYTNLVSAIGDNKKITVECLFADPVGDIAILGEPDGESLYDECDRYREFAEAISPIKIRKSRKANSGEKVWVLDLAGKLLPATVTEVLPRKFLLSGVTFDGGMSGSPVLSDDGFAVGLAAISEDDERNTDQQSIHLPIHLPGWFFTKA